MLKEGKRVVPYNVDWIVSRMHVGVSYEEVALDIQERVAANNPSPDPVAVSRLQTEAIIAHKRNRELYTRVMG